MNQRILKNKTNKKFLIVWGSVFIAVILLVTSIFIVLHLINGSSPEQKLGGDFTLTIDAILGKSSAYDAHISGLTAMTGNSFTIFDDSELEKAVSSHIQYDVLSQEINGDTAILTVKLVSPDIYTFLQKSIEDGFKFNTIKDITDYLIKELDKGIDTIELTTECSFEYVDEHWYWIPSKEVLNALSGNLYMYFENNGYNNDGGK